jgi:hypothetical protein
VQDFGLTAELLIVQVDRIHWYSLYDLPARGPRPERRSRGVDFHVTVTFCFTHESCGLQPHHTSPTRPVEEFAEFCASKVRRYVD